MSELPLPPPLALRRNDLVIEDLPPRQVTRVLVTPVADGLGEDITIPVVVARGRRPGPVFGVTAALHGNELNGIPVIHRLLGQLDVGKLRGTVVGVLCTNVPGLHRHQREFVDGTDLNRIFPGRPDGNVAEVYAHRIMERIVSQFDWLVDLHTASFGRVNSLYVRADMTDERCARMAYLQRPQIIVHNAPSDSTLRGAAMDLDIPSITVEVGDPQRFQGKYIQSAVVGLRSILVHAELLAPRHGRAAPGKPPVVCAQSRWLYTDRGGLLDVIPEVTDRVVKDQVVGRLRNAFGDLIREYRAPWDGVVVGKSTNPVGQTGSRVLHLGRVADPESDSVVPRS